LAREIGDFVDELHQLAAVAITALVVLGVIYLATAALWPINPSLATAVAAVSLAGLALTVWRMRRRP
jgi:lysozyme family protein